VYQVFIDFKKASDSVTSEVLCNILSDSDIPMKIVTFKKKKIFK